MPSEGFKTLIDGLLAIAGAKPSAAGCRAGEGA